MEILSLKAYSGGYRGCLMDEHQYKFFQYTPKRGFKDLKSYPKSDFTDYHHFIAMMQKFMSASAFIVPPAVISELTVAELNRVYAN
jgi:hypothetical protein